MSWGATRWIGRHERAFYSSSVGLESHRIYNQKKDAEEELRFIEAVEETKDKEFFLKRVPMEPCNYYDHPPDQYLLYRTNEWYSDGFLFASFYNPLNAIMCAKALNSAPKELTATTD